MHNSNHAWYKINYQTWTAPKFCGSYALCDINMNNNFSYETTTLSEITAIKLIMNGNHKFECYIAPPALGKKYTREGKFIIFPGFEYTYHDACLKPDFNHRYVIYPRKGNLYRRTDPNCLKVDELVNQLEKTDGLAFAHHTTWKLTGSLCDNNVEVCSSWRVCIEESDFIDKRLNVEV